MAARHGSRPRFLTALAVIGSFAMLAFQPLAAHAATPAIHATVDRWGRTTVYVSGSGFGPGDQVRVVESAGPKIIHAVVTTATRFILPPPICIAKNPCYTSTIVGGAIKVTMPRYYVHCAYEIVAVQAYDLTNHAHSNVVFERLGLGPCLQ